MQRTLSWPSYKHQAFNPNVINSKTSSLANIISAEDRTANFMRKGRKIMRSNDDVKASCFFLEIT